MGNSQPTHCHCTHYHYPSPVVYYVPFDPAMSEIMLIRYQPRSPRSYGFPQSNVSMSSRHSRDIPYSPGRPPSSHNGGYRGGLSAFNTSRGKYHGEFIGWSPQHSPPKTMYSVRSGSYYH